MTIEYLDTEKEEEGFKLFDLPNPKWWNSRYW